MAHRLTCVLLVVFAGCHTAAPASPPVSREPVPVTTSSEEARARFFSGRLKSERFHREAAIEDLRAAVEIDPDFAIAWLHLSWIAPSREEAEACLARAEQAIPRVSEAEALYVNAAMAGFAGLLGPAQTLLREVVDLYPGDARARYHLATNLWSADDPAAVRELETAVELDPGLDVAWNVLGYVAAHFGRLDEAVKAHRRYVRLLPEEPNAHDSLAETFLRTGRYADSIREYETALALDPSFSWSRIGIGHNLVFLGRFEDARASYEAAISEAASPREIHEANGWLIALGIYAGRSKDAVAAAERGVQLAAAVGDHEAALAVRTLARTWLVAGDTAKARDFAGQALARLGEDAAPVSRRQLTHSVLRLLAEIDLADGDTDSARTRVREVSDLSESLWEVRLAAFADAFVAQETGDPVRAVEVLDGAPFESDPRYLHLLGCACRDSGDAKRGDALLARVVSLNTPSLGHALVFADARAKLAGAVR